MQVEDVCQEERRCRPARKSAAAVAKEIALFPATIRARACKTANLRDQIIYTNCSDGKGHLCRDLIVAQDSA